MKKFVIILLVVCLVFAGAAGFIICRNGEKAAESPENTEAPASPAINFRVLDMDELYALHRPDEVVAVINGNEILWEDYFYNVFNQSMQIQEYFKGMAQYYNMQMDWADPMNENGMTFADSVLESAEHALIQFEAIKGFAEENNVVLGEDIQNEMKVQHEADRKALCGDDATEEDFADYLKNIFMNIRMYDEMNRINHLYQQSYIQIYGENGEKLSDEAALKFLNDGKFMYANHILLATVNMENGEALDEAAVEEKEAMANKISSELRAIENNEELLECFAELKKEFCEDSGKKFFPDGMTFKPGAMVAEFENGVTALKEYEVSEPVKSQFGYHVIIRLPLDPDAVLEYTQTGTPVTVRGAAANMELGERFQEYFDSLQIEYAEGFERPELLAYVK